MKVQELELRDSKIHLTDEVMKSLGFYKQKNYKKKQTGVSSKSWYKDGTEFLTIEKHHFGVFDEGQTFFPTFRFSNCFRVLVYVSELKTLYKGLTGETLKFKNDGTN